jgi:hypothetical protein
MQCLRQTGLECSIIYPGNSEFYNIEFYVQDFCVSRKKKKKKFRILILATCMCHYLVHSIREFFLCIFQRQVL